MGSQTAVPKPSTGGDNAMMDAAAASGGSSSSLPTGGDVGLGQTNSLPDVQAVNAALNANGIGTPYGGDIVDTDAIKAGQAKLSQATGVELKQDGWVGPKTKQAFQFAQDSGLTKSMGQSQPSVSTVKLPSAKPLSTDKGRPQAEYFAQQNAIKSQAREQEQKIKQTGGQSAQALGQQAFHAMKSGNPLGAIKPPKMPKVNKSPLATQTTAPKATTPGFQSLASQAPDAGPDKPNPLQKITRALGAQSQEAGRQMNPQASSPVPQVPLQKKAEPKPAFKALPKVSDAARREAEGTVDWVRRHIDGIGDLGKDTFARAIDHGGEPVIAEAIETANAFKRADMPKQAEQLLKDAHAHVKNPTYRERLKEAGNHWYNGGDVFSNGQAQNAVIRGNEPAPNHRTMDIRGDESKAASQNMGAGKTGTGKALPAVPDSTKQSNAKTVEYLKRHKDGVGDLGEFQAQAIDGKGEGSGLTAISETVDLIGQLKAKGEQDRANALETDTLQNIKSPDMREVLIEKVGLLNQGGDPFAVPEGATLSAGTNDGNGTFVQRTSQDEQDFTLTVSSHRTHDSQPATQADAEGFGEGMQAVHENTHDYQNMMEEKKQRIAERDAERQQKFQEQQKKLYPTRIFADDLGKESMAEAKELGLIQKDLKDQGLWDDPQYAKERAYIEGRMKEVRDNDKAAINHYQTTAKHGFSEEDEKTFLGTEIHANQGVKHFMDKTKDMSDADVKELATRYGIDPDRLQIARDLQRLKPGDWDAVLDLKDRISDAFQGEDGGTFERMAEGFYHNDDPKMRDHLMSDQLKFLRLQDVSDAQKLAAKVGGTLVGEMTPTNIFNEIGQAANILSSTRKK